MSAEKICVSIVMPVLNGMPYFEEALESVINQSLKEIEIIVVDAGSTDGTKEYVNKISSKDNRVRLIESDYKSMGRQYNMGIQSAKGEYIGFCESDDYIELNMMEDLYSLAVQNNYPDAVKANFFMYINEGSDKVEFEYKVLPIKSRHLYGRESSIYDDAGLYNRDVNMWNAIYNKDFLMANEVVFNETPAAAFQDAGFIAQIMMFAKRQYYVDKAYYHYRRDNAESSMFKDTSKFWAWETVYILDIMKRKYLQVKDIADIILGRLFVIQMELFAKDIYMKKASIDDENVKKAINAIYEYCKLMSDAEKTFVAEIEEGCKKAEKSIENAVENYQIKMNKTKIVRDLANKCKKVVIFGAGELGISMLAFFKKNNYDGAIYFCDNSISNVVVMGCDVLSVEDATKAYPDALYIITNSQYVNQMKPQLLTNGISSDNICIIDSITPHFSMEIDWNRI